MTDHAAIRPPLRHPDFRRLWASLSLSDLGDAFGRVALVIVVFGETGSALAAALVPALGVAPFLGPGQWLTGYLDRFPRKAVLVGTDLVRAACFAVMALPIGTPARLALLLVSSVAEPPFLAIRRSLLPSTLPKARLDAGIRIVSVSTEMALLGGAVLGGVLTQALGAEPVMLLNAATFVASAAFLAGLRVGNRTVQDVRKAPSEVLRQGWQAVRSDRIVLLATIFFPLISATALAVEAAVAPFVLDEMGRGDAWVGYLSGAVSLGVVAGAALQPRRADHASLLGQIWQTGALGSALALAAFLLPLGSVTALAAFAAVGLVYSARVPGQVLYGQRIPERDLAGATTVTDAYYAAVVLATSIAVGVAVDLTDARVTVVAACCVGLLACVATFAAARRVSPSTPG